MSSSAEEVVHRAYRIAVPDLRACYNPDGIVAGRLHFNAYWARDGSWASLGALALGDTEQVKAHLNLFVQHQMPSGKLPVRVEFLGHTFGHYHTRRMHLKALYRTRTVFADPLDPTALFIIAAREYFTHSHDMDFAVHFEPAMDRAVRWLLSHDRDGDGLIESRYLAGWMDSS
jgi:glycogen debranching enzyme